MDKKRKTAIYCRTAYADEAAIAEQEARLRAYAEEHGYADTVCYRDSETAGNTLSRPVMTALTADIKAGEIGAVIVTDISRIARTFPLVSAWRELLCEHGVKFIALADDSAEATAELTYRLVGDYLLPNIALSEPPDAAPLGRYGMLHKAYLR
ncbi:MAG: recombinase family protein, partial [Clostridiales Family XIII bacterium]|nr:recombinase family protein [Clostridiales Family XIII bacterium]